MSNIQNCPYCGTKLIITNYGNKWCPNCGKIEDDNYEEDLKGNYIG